MADETWPRWKRLFGYSPPWDVRAELIASQRARLTSDRERLIATDSPEARRAREQRLTYIAAALDSLEDDGVLAIPKGCD